MVRILLCAAALLAVALPACKTNGGTTDPSPNGGRVIKTFDFPDLPVPRDFEYVEEKSHIVQNAAFRTGTIVYVGSLRMEYVRDWYKRTMTSPACGWKQVAGPTGETGVGPYTLRFEKGSERCDVHIEAPKLETIVTVVLALR